MERTITLLFVGWIIGMISALSPSISEIKSLQLKIEQKNELIDSLENELIIINLLK